MTTVRHVDAGSFFRFEIDDFASFRWVLGEELLAAFCRCFVHADRLTSLIHFVRLLEKHCPPDSVAVTRDLHSMSWFAVGTLREYGKAIGTLKSEFVKASIFERDTDEWRRLLELEKRWERDPIYVKLRNQVAFHVDPKNKIIPRGLDELTKRTPVTLFFSDKPGSPTFDHGHWYRLGMETILEGYGLHFEGEGIQRSEFSKLFEQVAQDMTVSESLFNLFRKTLERKGIRLVDGRKTARQSGL